MPRRSRRDAVAERAEQMLAEQAERMRGLGENHGMSLSKLLKDAILVYGGQVDAGYEPGALLAEWTAEQREHTGDA